LHIISQGTPIGSICALTAPGHAEWRAFNVRIVMR
jgi:hypothetical protein